MTKTMIKDIIAACLRDRKLCRVFLRYDLNYFYYFPLMLNDRLFLGIEEDDFLLDGYFIRRFKDVTKAEIKDDFCGEIIKQEGLIDRIEVPDVDLTSWETIFRSLQERDKNIIVEKENLDENECEFIIGRIEKIYKKFIYVRHFDADGIWQQAPFRIPYTEITSIIFASRYVETFSKYLSELPDNFGKL